VEGGGGGGGLSQEAVCILRKSVEGRLGLVFTFFFPFFFSVQHTSKYATHNNDFQDILARLSKLCVIWLKYDLVYYLV